MMKRDGGLDHGLEKEFFLWSNFAHPAFFPRVVRGVKFAGIIEIDAGDVFDRIRSDMRVEIGGHCFAFNRAAITFAAVAPAPAALLIVGASGFETSPTAKTIGTLVSCVLLTLMKFFSSVSSWSRNNGVFGSTPMRIRTPRTAS